MRWAWLVRWPPAHWRLAFQGNLHELGRRDFGVIERAVARDQSYLTKGLIKRASDLAKQFPEVSITHVERAKNSGADALANMAIDAHVKKQPGG